MARFEFLTAGESHGPELTIIIRGIPAGLRLDRDGINAELRRRQQGYGRGGRMAIERDEAIVTAGVRGGETLGSPIAMRIVNRDFEQWRDAMDPWDVDDADVERRRLRSPRPGHADLAGGMKFDRRDLRDILERASARETAARVAAGGVAKQLLAHFGIEIRSSVLSIGPVGDPDAEVSWDALSGRDADSSLPGVDPRLEKEMIAAIDRAKEDGDTWGGTIAVAANGVPPGLGSTAQWDEKLDGRLAQSLMSIPAVKGVAIGIGFKAATLPGSEVHDAIDRDPSGFSRRTNRAGGLEGGMTNGELVLARVAMKPISTLRKGLPSVDLDTGLSKRSQWERSDVTAVPACAVICEAMVAMTLAGAMREKFGGDSIGEMERNVSSYLEQVKRYPPGGSPAR
ncbi:MAG TPA: chorismate synthase [Thermoanaerobaculia bacterium]|nr:chorismate synthase [Thermoanaerobaculia bacterium]